MFALERYRDGMGESLDQEAQVSPASDGKAPRTARGERTLRKILDAARDEFGERGFSDSSIVAITQRAGVALGTFYTYFDSKEAVFQALVSDMSAQVRDHVAPAFADATDAIDGERRALESFLSFARTHRDVYRIIDEAEFVEPAVYRAHYETTATRIAARLKSAREIGEIAADLTDAELEIISWAMMGANVFLGLKFEVWSSADPARVADVTGRLLRKGLCE
jgi:AcrR family transcriptional regulator